MRRFRNPAYASEFLERKLSPAGLSGIPVAAEVFTPTATGSDATSSDPSDSTSPDDSTDPTDPGSGATDPTPPAPTTGGGTDPLPSGPDGGPVVIPTTNPYNPNNPS